jgi:trehalose-phosphatase
MQEPLEPTTLPEPLPSDLLPDLLHRGNLLLCLDYDGTLSEITSKPAEAHPVPGIADSLLVLSQYRSRLEIAIISGRELETLRKLLGLHFEAWLIGTHGLEMIDRAGQRVLAPGAPDYAGEVECLRRWVDKELHARSGFVIEDKELAIAIHYRLAALPAATSIRRELQQFVERHCPHLRIIQGKMVDEFVPRDIGGKGYAVRWLVSSMAKKPASIVYFGDDTTDEDAFFELRDRGVTVLVGPCRRSWARYFVAGPAAVAGLLRELAIRLENSPQ